MTVAEDLALYVAWVAEAPAHGGRVGSLHKAEREVGMVLEARRRARVERQQGSAGVTGPPEAVKGSDRRTERRQA